MLSWSITFLIVGLIAGLLGLSGIAGAATQIVWILFVVFLVLFLLSLVMGRRPPVVQIHALKLLGVKSIVGLTYFRDDLNPKFANFFEQAVSKWWR